MPISTTDLIELDTSEVKVLGKSLATIARESPKTVRMALGRQVRNTQKSIAATVRNYALRSKVEGKRTTLARFPKRHPITVSLHGKKGGGKLGDNRAVSVTRGGNEFAVGYKGGLTPFAERWQTGGKVGLYRDSAANHIRTRLFKPQWDALMQDPAFQWRVYRVLGRLYDIHTPEELEAASGDSAGAYFAAMLGTTAGIAALEDKGMGNPEESSAVQAVIGMFGVYGLAMQSRFTEDAPPMPSGVKLANYADVFAGAVCRDCPGLAALASPDAYVTKDCPPMLIQGGTADEIVPYEGSVALAERVNAVCGEGRAILEPLPGATHGHPDYASPERERSRFEFLDRVLMK